MYCNQCGKQLPDDAKYCHHCGSAVGGAQVNTTKSKKIFVIGIIAALLLACVMIIVGVLALLPFRKPVANIPDPEYYFPVVTEVAEEKELKRVIVRSGDELWQQVAGYVDLLKSESYPFQTFNEELYPSGDYSWFFEYTNESELKDPYYCQIEVNYYRKDNASDNYAIWITIHDLEQFELVENEKYEPQVVAETEENTDVTDTPEVSVGVEDMTTWDHDTEDSYIADTSNDYYDDSDDDSDDDYEVPEVSDIYDTKTPCGVCNRSGDCKTCGGDGYLMSSASDKEDRNCYSCNGSGNCRSCGGDGEL